MRLIALFERVIDVYTLTIINLIIVISVELTGSGEFFKETGLIHATAIVFVILTAAFILSSFNLMSASIRRVYLGSIVALFFLSLIHVVEYLGDRVLMEPENFRKFMVTNFYTLGFASFVFSFIPLFRILKEKHAIFLAVTGLASFAALASNILFFKRSDLLNNFNEKAILFAAFAVSVVLGLGVIFLSAKIKKKPPYLREFLKFLSAGMVLIIVSSFFEFLEIFEDYFKVEELKLEYLAHYTFYAAISVLLLGFKKLFYLEEAHQGVLKAKRLGA